MSAVCDPEITGRNMDNEEQAKPIIVAYVYTY